MIEHAALPRHSPAVLLNQVVELLVRAGMITPFIKEYSSGKKVTFWKKVRCFRYATPYEDARKSIVSLLCMQRQIG